MIELKAEEVEVLTKLYSTRSGKHEDDRALQMNHPDCDCDCDCDCCDGYLARYAGELYIEDLPALKRLVGLELAKDLSAEWQIEDWNIFQITLAGEEQYKTEKEAGRVRSWY